MYTEDLLYEIGLTLIKGVGDVTAKNLLAYCGSARAVFTQQKKFFLKIPGIAERTAQVLYASIRDKEILMESEREIKWMMNHSIVPLFFSYPNYPDRLRNCIDSPVMIYAKGNADLNSKKIISIVGTRRPSPYGLEQVEKLLLDFIRDDILVLSGLAYGIDVAVHKNCLKLNIPTVGVLAHGLQMVYPPAHKLIAKKMCEQGALLTEFRSSEFADKENFPRRNRIVAGMCDALLVVETRNKGGSLITAEIAFSYHKDIFALPGRAGEELSAGCNRLIKKNKAVLVENADDIREAMGWDSQAGENNKKNGSRQAKLFMPESLSEDEQKIFFHLQNKSPLHVDEISHLSEFSISKTVTVLLQLEFSNIVRSLPGKMFSLNQK